MCIYTYIYEQCQHVFLLEFDRTLRSPLSLRSCVAQVATLMSSWLPSVTTAGSCQREALEASFACLGWTSGVTGAFTTEGILVLVIVGLCGGLVFIFGCCCGLGSSVTVQLVWKLVPRFFDSRWGRVREAQTEAVGIVVESSSPDRQDGEKRTGLREVRRPPHLARKTFTGEGGRFGH